MEVKGDGDMICVVCCQTFKTYGAKCDSQFISRYQKLFVQLRSSLNIDDSWSGDVCLVLACQKCVSCLSSALDKKTNVVSLEAEVRKLQVQILNLLRSLKSGIDSFQEEVDKMQEILETGGGWDKVEKLDDFFLMEDERCTTLKDAIQFREKILTVVQDLRLFNGEIGMIPGGESKDVLFAPKSESEDDDDGQITTEASGDDDGNGSDNYSSASCSKIINPDGSEDDDCSEEEHAENMERCSESGDSDPEFVPSKLTRKKKGDKKAESYKSVLSSLDMSGMTKFKKKLLKRIITKFERHQHQISHRRKRPSGKSSQFDDLDPLNTHLIRYDPATDSLSLCGVDIIMNEKEETLQCSQCDFKYRKKDGTSNSSVEVPIYSHILGRHLNLFKCPICDTSLSSYGSFRLHVLAHRNRLDCDICGKTLSSHGTLRNHKWSHMNEEEKAEAEKNGVNPGGKKMKNRQKLEKKVQCSTCGKGFTFMSFLKIHEQTHRKEPRYICPHCGNTFRAYNGLHYHLKYVCFPGKGTVSRDTVLRFQCDQCPKKFSIQSKLNEHKETRHSKVPSYKCSLCEKAFRTKQILRNHERVHSDTRPYLCRKECGATYKHRKNRTRHEKSCKKLAIK